MSQQLSEVDGGPLHSKQSIFECIEEGLIKDPSAPAVIVMFQPADHLSELVREKVDLPRNGLSAGEDVPDIGPLDSTEASEESLTWTFKQLHLASCRFANALLRAGVQSETSKVISLIPNGIEIPLLLWTTALARLTLCNLDVGALQPTRRTELENFLGSLHADVILVPDVTSAEAVDVILSQLSLPQPKVKLIVPAAGLTVDNPPKWDLLSSFVISRGSAPLKDEETLRRDAKLVDPQHVASILFTSGTSSGKPKGCLRVQQQLGHILESQQWLTPSGNQSRMLIAGANFRAMSYAFILQAWYAGGAAVFPFLTFSAESILQAIQIHRIDTLVFVPYHFHVTIDSPNFSATDVSSVRMAVTGGDMVTEDLLWKIKRAFPDAEKVHPGHGMTEGGGLYTWNFGNDLAKVPHFGSIAPLGSVAKGARMRIVDKETGKVTMRGEPGELHVSSVGFADGYLGGVKKEDFYTDDTGKWFKTGDLGMIASDGCIYILGRIKDIIKRAGVPITPAALENTIEKHTKCPCSVIGVPHPTLGAEPYAVVQNFDLADEAQIRQSVLDEFGKDYALAGAVSLKQLGLTEFPLNATAKIVKNELQQPVLKYIARTKNQ